MECSPEILKKLAKLEIFSDFVEQTEENIRILEKIALLLQVKNFVPNDMIIQEGDFGDTLYILYEGTVQVRRNTPSNEQFAVVNLKAGQNVFFGEVALIDNDKRSASVVAMENCKILCLDGEQFQKLCEEEPVLGYRAITRIAKRIAASLRRSNKDMMTLYTALLDEVNGE